MSAKTKSTGLMLADVASLTAAATADQIAAQSKVINRAFVDRGKLIYHLDSIKLRAGQTVYGMLKSRGVSEGSIHSARTVANLISALVVPGHVPEEKFDAVITFRTARIGDLILKGKSKVKLAPEALATILLSGNTAAVGAELDCLHDHGMTIAEREAKLKEEEELRAQQAADAAELERIKAQEAANPTPPPVAETDDEEADDEEADDEEADDEEADDEEADDEEADDEEADDEEADDEEADDEEADDEAPEAVIINGPGTVGGPAPAPTPKAAATPPPAPPVTLDSIVDRLNSALIDAMDLNAEDMTKLVAFLHQATAELESTVQAAQAA
jgi:hypothetical protein